MIKQIWGLLILTSLIGCTTLPKGSVTDFSLLPPEELSLDKISVYDMAYLDKAQYLVSIEGAKGKMASQKRVGLIFTTETLKQQQISITSINLKSWLVKELKGNGYYIERISPRSQVVILVEYGVQEIKNSTYEQQFQKKLYNRYLNLRALNYPKFKEDKQIEVLWETRISSLGPETDINKILPVLSALVPEVVGQNKKEILLVAKNDPRLENTKEVPTAISVEEFKPTVEELKFFN